MTKRSVLRLIVAIAAAFIILNILIVHLAIRSKSKRVELGMTQKEVISRIGPPDHIAEQYQVIDGKSVKLKTFSTYYYFPYLWDWATVPFVMCEVTTSGKLMPLGRCLELRFNDYERLEIIFAWNHSRQKGVAVKYDY